MDSLLYVASSKIQFEKSSLELYDEICMFCLTKSEKLELVNTIPRTELFWKLSNIQITSNNTGLPQKICHVCLQNFNSISKFVNQINENVAKFNEFYQQKFIQLKTGSLLLPKLEFEGEFEYDEPEIVKIEEIDEIQQMEIQETDEEEINGKKSTTSEFFKCSLCDKEFPTYFKLQSHHRLIHKESEDFHCFTCGKIFQTKSCMEEHILKTHLKNKGFSSQSDLNEHLNTNTDIEYENTPPDILLEAQNAEENLLPTKSKILYEKAYEKFMSWCDQKNVKKYSENVLMAYFSHLKTSKYKSSTLWATYSMLKSTLNIKKNVNIRSFAKLIAFLKKTHKDYIPNKSNTFTKDQIDLFLKEAPDKNYLAMKVILIFGISGACRCDQLVRLTLDDVEDFQRIIHVKITFTKTKIPRSFTIIGELYINLIRNYMKLRPKDFTERRFFIKYRNGQCTKSVIGIHKIGQVPQDVAKFLKLNNANLYTGHALRRTSATLLIDSGAWWTGHGGWKSSTVAEGYIDESMKNKNDVAVKILQSNSTNIVKERTETITSAESMEFQINDNDNIVKTVETRSSPENFENLELKIQENNVNEVEVANQKKVNFCTNYNDNNSSNFGNK